MKKHQYSLNYRGKCIIVVAYSKKQIMKELRITTHNMRGFCSKCSWQDDRKIDKDLTKEGIK